jgi:hypothetical protein
MTADSITVRQYERQVRTVALHSLVELNKTTDCNMYFTCSVPAYARCCGLQAQYAPFQGDIRLRFDYTP